MVKSRKSKASSGPASIISSTISSRYLTPSSSQTPSTLPSRAPTPPSEEEPEEELAVKRQPFRFFDLPSELRVQIYEEALHISARDVLELYEGKKKAKIIMGHDERPAPPLDLEPNINWYLIRPRLNLFLTSHRTYEEAYRIFYSQPMRLYPLHGRFFNTKKPLLARLPPKYRKVIQTLELRLGPGWSKPPRAQNTSETLGLRDCTNTTTLKIFVELDPSEQIFHGFRGENATEDTYKWFCIDLVRGIFEQIPSLKVVEIDAFPGVKKDAPLVAALRRITAEAGKPVVWGPLRGWEDNEDMMAPSLEHAMAGMGLGDASRIVEVQA